MVVAPSMNDNMYKNPVTQENIDKLKKRGFAIVEPEYGRLASGKIGQGRLAEIEKIIEKEIQDVERIRKEFEDWDE